MPILRVSRWLICALVLALAIPAGRTTAQGTSGDSPFMARMELSMKVMDRSMDSAPMNGDADHDFASMMIPHHEGAIEMAKAELSFGKDPVMRRLAQEILVDQKSEIDAMNLWLTKRNDAPRTGIAK